MLRKKIILSAGGTGGHLFPAQALAKQLALDYDLLFVAGGLSTSRFFDSTHFSFHEIPTATFQFSQPLQFLKGGKKIYHGMRKSLVIIKEFEPDLVIGFGSFFTLPVLMAALKKRIPFILHEQNAVPGKVNRFFSRFAEMTAITFPETAHALKGGVQQVRYPLKTFDCRVSKKEALDYFCLSEAKKTLLIFGGSQGGKGINQLVMNALPFLKDSFQILHFTGKHDSQENIQKMYLEKRINAVVKAFEDRMECAWIASDFALTRAGAGTIAELIEFEKPALLIPFPYASENHQKKNGQFFTEKIQGGIMVPEHELCGKSLAAHLRNLISAEQSYCQSIRKFKQEQKDAEFIHVIHSFLTSTVIRRKNK